jgi:hypothetical protein
VHWSAAFLSVANLLILERETGLEPATSSLGSWHSTTELLPLESVFNYLAESKDFKPIDATVYSVYAVHPLPHAWIAKRTA